MKSKAQGDHPSLSIGVADFGGVEFELLRRWSAGTVMTPKVMRRRRTQRLETRKKRKKHKATTGDMKSSDNSTFDSFDGVGVVDVVEALQLKMYKGLDVLARGSDYGRREYLRNVLFADTPDQPGNGTAILCSRRSPQNAALVAHR
jgi:hypothetical protein